MPVARWSSSGKRPLWVGSRCWTTTKARPLPAGTCRKNSSRASRPPAEAPMPTMGKRPSPERGTGVGRDGAARRPARTAAGFGVGRGVRLRIASLLTHQGSSPERSRVSPAHPFNGGDQWETVSFVVGDSAPRTIPLCVGSRVGVKGQNVVRGFVSSTSAHGMMIVDHVARLRARGLQVRTRRICASPTPRAISLATASASPVRIFTGTPTSWFNSSWSVPSLFPPALDALRPERRTGRRRR